LRRLEQYQLPAGRERHALRHWRRRLLHGDRERQLRTAVDFEDQLCSFEPAWHQSAGYSDAVGLGSVNIANLVNDWTSSTWITPFASTTTVTATPSTISS
jgi:hypothetical protein